MAAQTLRAQVAEAEPDLARQQYTPASAAVSAYTGAFARAILGYARGAEPVRLHTDGLNET